MERGGGRDRDLILSSSPPFEKWGQGGFLGEERSRMTTFKGPTYRKDLKPLARQLRSNMTDAERKLWQRLRAKQLRGVQFYRQKPVGACIVDFFAPRVGLVIEVDGGQHFDDQGRATDAQRDGQLARLGLSVLRFNNRQVLHELEAVVERIDQVLIEKLER